MRYRRPSPPTSAIGWWAVVFLLSLASWSFATSVPTSSMVGGDGDRRRLLLEFQEKRGNASFQCSPSGPCLPCQYSEKNDEKYHCSETGYRVPLKCIEIKDRVKGKKKKDARNLLQQLLPSRINNFQWRKLLDDSSKSQTALPSYITYRSCIPIENEEKLSFIGFEVIMVGLLLVSGPVVYLRQKRTAPMPGAVRIPTNIPRF